jgi:hypothetical protein
VYSEVGKYSANDKYLEVEVVKNKLYYQGKVISDGI